MRYNKIIVFLVLIFIFSPLYAENSFKTEDIYSIKSVTLSDVTDDGRGVVFLTSQGIKKEDNFKRTLYFLDTKKGKKIKLLESQGKKGMGFSSVKFSSDSKSIYFLSSGIRASRKNNTQVWSLNLTQFDYVICYC